MTRLRSFILVFGFAFFEMTGCSSPLRITLFNDSGVPVTLQLRDQRIAIKPEQSAEFVYPGTSEGWVFRVQSGACEFAYQMPQNLEHLPTAAQPSYEVPGGLKTQIERDRTVMLLPVTATTLVSVDRLSDLQQGGFPLVPALAKCR